MDEIEYRVERIIERVKSDKILNKLLLFDFALDGIVIDEEKARRGPCECIKLDGNRLFCWDKGIIGALDQDQIAKYCKTENTRYISSGPPEHVRHFIEASEQCRIGKTYDGKEVKDIRDRIECMSVLLRRKGVEI